MKRLGLISGILLLLSFMAAPVFAQAGFGNTTGYVLTTCGSPPNPFVAGNPGPFTVDTTGKMCGNTSVSVSGFPTVQTTGTPISVTTGGVTGTLPGGTVVVASNVGTTNTAYCKLGASATTSDQPIAPNGGWFSFTVGANTQLTCITSTSTTTVNMVGGSGLPTGTGGGSGGGGAVTVANGANVVEGTTTDAAVITDATGTLQQYLRGLVALGSGAGINVKGIGCADNTVCPTGSEVMGLAETSPSALTSGRSGYFSLVPTTRALRGDQYSWAGTVLGTPTNFGTTPGAVIAAGVNASHFLGTVAASAGTGNSGTGTQRVVLATDQPSLTNSLPVVNGSTSAVNTIAASQSAQILSNTSGGGTGATGDYLSHCWVFPTSTSPGVVTIIDNATTVFPFPGGASSVSNLVPFSIAVGTRSKSGAWKVTTGANLSVSCVGTFS